MTANPPTGNRCRVCSDPRLDQIESELVKPGTVVRSLARSFGLGRMFLQRHARHHLPERMKRAAEVAKQSPASPKTFGEVAEHRKVIRAVVSRAYSEGNLPAAIGASGEWRKGIELEARLLGQLSEGPTTNVLAVSLSPDQAAGMAEILLQRHRGRTVETTAVPELPALETPEPGDREDQE